MVDGVTDLGLLADEKKKFYEEGRRVALQHYQPHNCRHRHHHDFNHHISHHQDHVCAGKLNQQQTNHCTAAFSAKFNFVLTALKKNHSQDFQL